MKNIIRYISILFAAMIVLPTAANAVVADPSPKTVTQPDGTVITIQVHGDEFLNWTTSGGKLVAKAADGFYYYATFNADGTKKLSSVKVSERPSTMGFTEVRPPQSAIMRAKDMRRQFNSIIAQSSSSSPISIGNKRFLVILVEFSDLYFSIDNPNQAFDDMCNKDGYSANGGTGSVSQFYKDNSMGRFIPQFDVVGPVEVSHNHAYYSTEDDEGARKLLIEACRIADRQVDFSDYDLDGDGRVDNIFLFYAGYNQAEGGGDDCIWPHSWSVLNLNVWLDNVQLGHYACTSELRGNWGTSMAGISTTCHEFGHVLGLLDYYDTDYEENGEAKGLWDLSLMDTGSYNNNGNTPPYLDGYSRYFLGWEPEIVQIDSPGEKTLENISNNIAYILKTDREGEYYLLESRSRTGWDQYAKGLNEGGLVVYHIDKSDNLVADANKTASYLWRNTNEINAYVSHQCFDLIENTYPESKASQTNLIFPGRSNITTLSGKTNPSFQTWDGNSLFTLTDIRRSGDNVKFNLAVKDKILTGNVRNTAGHPVRGVNVCITETSVASVGNISVKSAPAGAEVYNAVTDADGHFEITIGQNPATDYQIKATCSGYADYFGNFNLNSGEKNLNLTIMTHFEDSYRNLQKFGDNDRYSIGFESGDVVMAKAEFYADELKEYAGDIIKNVNLMIKGHKAQSLSVFVEIGGERVCEKNVAEPVFGSIFSVDIVDKNIVVPADRTLAIGYEIKGCDDRYPVFVDGEKNAGKGGGFLSPDGSRWMDITAPDLDFGNVIISATVMPDSGMLSVMGFNYIISPKKAYSAGDVFEFKLSQSVRAVRNVRWIFDGEEKSEPSIVLKAGQHEIRAIIEYDGSRIETVVTEINVE